MIDEELAEAIADWEHCLTLYRKANSDIQYKIDAAHKCELRLYDLRTFGTTPKLCGYYND